MSCSASAARVRGCAGNATGSFRRLSPSAIRPRRGCATFASRWTVATTYVPGSRPRPREDRRALARDRREPDGRVRHHVSHDFDPSLDAFLLELARRALVRAEQERGRAVDLDADVLLRHRPVAAPHPRLDVGERDARLLCGARAGERRGGVAVDEHPVGPLGGDRVEDPGLHRRDHLLVRQAADPEAVRGLREPELLEEHLRQLGVVVLPGVKRHLVDFPLSERDREGRGLDELRPVSDD